MASYRTMSHDNEQVNIRHSIFKLGEKFFSYRKTHVDHTSDIVKIALEVKLSFTRYFIELFQNRMEIYQMPYGSINR